MMVDASFAQSVTMHEHKQRDTGATLREDEKKTQGAMTYRIFHRYDIGDRGIHVIKRNAEAPDAFRVAIYCLRKDDEWFVPATSRTILSNFGMAALLISFYGYDYCQPNEFAQNIDLYLSHDFPARFGDAEQIANDPSLHRDGLRDLMARFREPI
jgi:hypothetical protein